MDKIKIEEIAQELGSTSKKVYEKAVLMSINVKSIKSSVTVNDAQRIFDSILYNKNQTVSNIETCNNDDKESEYNSFYKKSNLYISFTNQNIDLKFNKHIKDTFESEDIDNFLLFSYSHNDDKLKLNFKEFYDDFDMGTIDDKNPLENLEYYIKRYNPQAILIDGIDFGYLDNHFGSIFQVIEKISKYKIKYNFSIVSISTIEQNRLIARINKFFKPF